MRLLVCGGRDYANAARVDQCLRALAILQPLDCIIHGAAGGTDTLAAQWAVLNGVEEIPFPVPRSEWHAIGPSAGPRRNSRMLAEGKPTFYLAFPGGRGTADMVRKCKAAHVRGIEVPH